MAYTVIHATHEALQKVGGIGAVLEGLISSPVYQKNVDRSFFVGPLLKPDDEDVLVAQGEVWFSTISGTQTTANANELERVAQRYNVNLIYGLRRFANGAEAEVLLVDAQDLNPRTSRNFKYNLYRQFGLASDQYEAIDDYSLYIDTAEALYDAVAVLVGEHDGPHIVLAHEYMGVPLALKTLMVNDPRFRAIFYAHEVSTVRNVVEQSAGHDVMFYNAMSIALEQGETLESVFGDRSAHYRHALVQAASHCDGVFAVGDQMLDELKFLGGFDNFPIDLVYNGIPAEKISIEDRVQSRTRLQAYCEHLLGYAPDVIMTHVTRPVVSKGVWRDLLVLQRLDQALDERGKQGVFFILATALGSRNAPDVLQMETEYGWPVVHRAGMPDLVADEVGIWRDVDAFNRRSVAIKAVFVNQFGWDRKSCGLRMPEEMQFGDLRKGTDVEFGQSIYEPFGIAVLEPLTYGAICVPSSVCGCCGFLGRIDQAQTKHVVVADYVSNSNPLSLIDGLAIDGTRRGQGEGASAAVVADKLCSQLVWEDSVREDRLVSGYHLAKQMSWDCVCEDYFFPGIERAVVRRV